ncbi:MAG: T9SS type A sorting domain-containing protein [Bacteroidales bacterium]|nr:T9SS type A sorting domain-containing protein [Bacteroidales bacterium]
MNKLILSVVFSIIGLLLATSQDAISQNTFYINANQTYLLPEDFTPRITGGDTIKIKADRTETIQFKGFEGNENNPIIVINDGGQVHITTELWGAIRFLNCKYIKVTGTGDSNFYYGFKLTGRTSGLSFEQYSSDVEVENVEIEGSEETFFGIYAKKDFIGNPPFPYPIFKNLSIHNNYIHDLAEGMYVGETTSPGMEFRHLRIYNNIIVNTRRESMQIANCIDDIEIYNNFFMNSGLEKMYTQDNGLQIGINTIANVYNNIMINANAYGIIVLGNGDIRLNNNYIQNSKGLFIDDRFEPLPFASIHIENNFIHQVNHSKVIENQNEFNDLFIANNSYNSDSVFFKNSITTTQTEIVLENNLYTEVTAFDYTLENGIFTNSANNSIAYQQMGPIKGLSHMYNSTPILDSIDNVLITFRESKIINLHATTEDVDAIHFESDNLPDFIQLTEISSGNAQLAITPTTEDKGVYIIGIKVYDESHHAYDRQAVRIAIKDPMNESPVLSFVNNFSLEATNRALFEITATDNNNDSIYYSMDNELAFVRIDYVGNQAFLNLQPKIEHQGVYVIKVTADDYYGNPTSRFLTLTIAPTTLTPGHLMYRINFGGPEIEDVDMNWQADIDREATYGTTHFLRTGSWFFKGVNNTSAPNALFGPYRYDGAEGVEMKFAFPLPGAGIYDVKLFFAERNKEVEENTTGVFNVSLENEKMLDHFNIYSVAEMEAYEISYEVSVTDGFLNLDFEQIENKDKINGIEIKYKSELAVNQAPKIQTATTFSMNENETLTVPVYLMDDYFEGSDSLSLVLLNAPEFIQLNAVSNAEYSLIIQPSFQDAGTYNHLLLVSSDGMLTDTLALNILIKNVNHVPTLSYIKPINIETGMTTNLSIQALDEDLEPLVMQIINSPSFVTFTDLGNGEAYLEMNPLSEHVGNYDFEISAKDPFNASASTMITIQVFERPTVERIILNSSMVTDLVAGGSRNTPLNLVDEQNLDPFQNEHPTSKSWVPLRKVTNGTFETMIDLGQVYYIDFAMLHDQLNSSDLNISVGEPGNWTEFATYTTSSTNFWYELPMMIQTRYVLLSMVNTIDAQINEIALYGYLSELIPDITPNQAPSIQTLSELRIGENETETISISILDDAYSTCNELSLSLETEYPFITLVKIDSINYSLNIQPQAGDAGNYQLTLFASDGCLNDTLSIALTVTIPNVSNTAPTINQIDSLIVEVGIPITVDIMSSDMDGDALYLYTINAPSFVVLTDNGDGTGSLSIHPTTEDINFYEMELLVEDEWGANTSTFFTIDVRTPPAVQRIILNSSMITDLVAGGSFYAPTNLVDEQTKDPLLNDHPSSKSWVPLKKTTNGTFEVIIDLGQEHYIDFAMFHDMQNTGDLHISIGEPGNWTEIGVNSTYSFKVWNQIDFQLNTRYILLSMVNTIYAQVNEIALYGYPLNPTKRSSFYAAIEETLKYTIYPNPSSDFIQINNKKEEQEIEIYSLSGSLVYKTTDSEINISSWINGLYLLRIIQNNELIFQDKFLKTGF